MKIIPHTLPNGLRSILVHMPDSPTVTALVLVGAGSRREKPLEHGLAHFLEHMCFKGTPTRPKAIDIARELEGLGAESNAFTGKGYTGYYAKAAAKYAGQIFDVVSDIYLNPLFPDEEIEKEKGVVIEEIKMYEDMPRSVVDDLYTETMFGHTPAGRTIIGTRESVQSFTREQIVTFRNRNYHAGTAVVVVAGAFDVPAMKSEIRRQFGAIAKGKLPKEPRYSFAAPSPVVVKTKPSEQTHLIMGMPSPTIFSKDRAVLSVLATTLGGGMSSRLFQRLREELGLCYYIYATQDANETYGSFSIGAGIPHGKEKDTIGEIRTILKAVATTGVLQSELTIAKNYLSGNLIMGLESSDDLAFYFGSRALHDFPLTKPALRIKEIQAVTVADVARVAKALFKPKLMRAALVTPNADAAALSRTITAAW